MLTAPALGLTGEQFDDGVGHDLVAAAGVADRDVGVGVAAERGVAGDALFDGQVPGQ